MNDDFGKIPDEETWGAIRNTLDRRDSATPADHSDLYANACLSEQIEVDFSQDPRPDQAYNRACRDCAEAVRAIASSSATPADHIADACTGPNSGLNQSLCRAIEASEAGHDAFCMSILRGKDCDCGFERRKRATPADHIGDAAEKVDAGSVPVAEMPLTSGAGPQKLAWFKHPDSFAPGTKLYAQPPQPEAQSVRDAWISVDERLPEQHEWVLVSDGTWSAIGMHLDDEDLEPNKRWMDESAELIESNGIKITHWQPLPAPPQKPVSEEVKP